MAQSIAIDGGEGAGKSTQVQLLARRLTEQADRPGLTPLITHEPGGTPLGSRLRELLLDVGQAPVGARAETLMMAADRAQHMDDGVRPM